MVHGGARGDAAGGASEYHREFGFPIERRRHLRIVADRIVPRDHRGRRFREDHRLLRQVLRRIETARRFSDMLGIVETDTKDILARARDWREQADIAKIGRASCRERVWQYV